MNAAQIENAVETVLPLIQRVVPGIAPFAGPIGIAIQAVAVAAPPLYAEIKNLIQLIHDGGEPTQAQLDSLKALLSNLQSPEKYFQQPGTPPPSPTS